ncbi:MAG: YeeE/YedE family protein, partial [Betaproteobacteria bacterium]
PAADSIGRRLQPPVLLAAAALALPLAAATAAQGPRMVVLLALGALLGATLYLASFGFASAYRRLIEQRDAAGVRAQLVMLAAATLLFAPVLAGWSGREVAAAVAPAGVSVAAGAFLFGAGMQFAGGCGSGTLYAAGGGQLRAAITLAAFIAGSFLASLHMQAWEALPALEPIALGERLGWPAALALQLGVLAALYALLSAFRPGPLAWPLAAAALALAVLNLLTLLVAGHPWSITWAFALWGAKVAWALGWRPEAGGFWDGGFQRSALESSVFADVTSVMDFGLVLGALAAAGAAGGFALRSRIPPRAALTALAGGLAMGYGARIAYGCNIGAFFSGVASTSLHGWLWIAAALPGCWAGLWLMRRLP